MHTNIVCKMISFILSLGEINWYEKDRMPQKMWYRGIFANEKKELGSAVTRKELKKCFQQKQNALEI